MLQKAKSFLTFLIGWPLSLIALFFIGKLIAPHFPQFRSHLSDLNYWMVGVGGLCFIVYYFLRSYLYQLIIVFLGYRLSLQESAFLWSQSEMHRYIPGNIWSFLGRSMLFSKKHVDKKDIAVSLIVENQLVFFGSLLVSLLAVPFLLQTFLPFIPFREFLSFLSYFITALIIYPYIYSSSFASLVRYNILKKIFLTPFSPQQNLSLILISAVSYFIFGLGYFFVMGSFINLPLQSIWVLIGFFAFSLLVGYLSFITPTGLGIREGAHLLGLKNFASFAVIGFASIFTRIILILSEFFYLILSYLWQKAEKNKLSKLESFVAKNKHGVLLGIAVFSFIIYFSLTSILRYDHFFTGRFDLGNMAQTVWNTLHGNIFRLTDPNGIREVSRLAFHADFILILLTPFYFIWENPKMLLLIQAVITGLGAIFVYLISQKVLKGRTLPLILSLLFLLNPSLQRATIYDFHAVAFATTFLLGAFYFVINKQYVWFVVFLLLACLTKEQVWLIAAFFGLYIAFFQKKLLPGLATFAVSVGVFVYLIFYAIPQAAGSEHFALSYYSDFGDKPGTIIKNIVFSPHQTIPQLFEPDRVRFYDQQLGPVGYMALLSPFYLIFASGDLVISLLSSNPQLRQIYYQYTATITPFVFLAAIYGIKRFERIFPGVPRFATITYLLLVGLYSAYLYGPLPGAREYNLAMYTHQRPNAVEIERRIQDIPLSYSVAATNNAGSHLSHRPKIYAFPKDVLKADVVVLLSDNVKKPFNESQRRLIASLKHDPNYIIFHEENDFIIFKKMQKF